MSEASDIAVAIQVINDRHGNGWQLAKKLAGGYSAGAHMLRGPDGIRAVLKLHPQGVTAERLAATAGVIDRAIAAGWKTPRWLASGLPPGGGFYVVQEFVDGERAERLTEAVLESLLLTNRRQADLRPETDRDWSAYVWDVVFQCGSDYARRMRGRADTSALFERLEAMTADARSVRLPTTDLVHGDFTLDNAVFSDGEVYLVDADFVGKGSRAIDLAILLVQAGTAQLGASASAIGRVRDECIDLVGRQGLLVCLAARMMGLVDFGLDHWSEDVPSFVARCNMFLDDQFGGYQTIFTL